MLEPAQRLAEGSGRSESAPAAAYAANRHCGGGGGEDWATREQPVVGVGGVGGGHPAALPRVVPGAVALVEDGSRTGPGARMYYVARDMSFGRLWTALGWEAGQCYESVECERVRWTRKLLREKMYPYHTVYELVDTAVVAKVHLAA